MRHLKLLKFRHHLVTGMMTLIKVFDDIEYFVFELINRKRSTHLKLPLVDVPNKSCFHSQSECDARASTDEINLSNKM